MRIPKFFYFFGFPSDNTVSVEFSFFRFMFFAASQEKNIGDVGAKYVGHVNFHMGVKAGGRIK